MVKSRNFNQENSSNQESFQSYLYRCVRCSLAFPKRSLDLYFCPFCFGRLDFLNVRKDFCIYIHKFFKTFEFFYFMLPRYID